MYKNKKVILSSLYYKPFVGGVENSLLYISQQFVQKGYSTTIFVSDLGLKGEVLKDEMDFDVNIMRYKYPRHFLSILKPLHIVISVFFKLSKFKVDKSIPFIARNHLVVIAARLYGFKKVVYIVPSLIKGLNTRSNEFFSFSERLRHYVILFTIVSQNIILQKLSFFLSNRIILFSDNMVRQVDKFGGRYCKDKIYKISPGVDHDVFCPSDTKRNILRNKFNVSDSFVILCLARISESKHFQDVLYAFSELTVDDQKDKKVFIVGDGEDKVRLISLAKELGIDRYVEFFNSTPNPEEFYLLSDCFMVTSYYEAFGQTIIEAMSCGVIPVAYNDVSILTASNEIIQHKFNGFLCKKTVLDLKNAILWIDSQSVDQRLKLVENCLKSSYSYDWSIFVDNLIAV